MQEGKSNDMEVGSQVWKMGKSGSTQNSLNVALSAHSPAPTSFSSFFPFSYTHHSYLLLPRNKIGSIKETPTEIFYCGTKKN